MPTTGRIPARSALVPFIRSTPCLALTASLLACGSDEIPPTDATGDQLVVPHLATVETALSAATIATGDSTTVTCTGKDQHGDPYVSDLPLEFEVFDANDDVPADPRPRQHDGAVPEP